MNKLTEWKLAQKIDESGRRGVIIGLAIAALVVATVVITILKVRCLKKQFGCLHCDVDELGDDFVDADGCDENGCCYTNENDFV